MTYTIGILRELCDTLVEYPVPEECKTPGMNRAISDVYGIIRTNFDPAVIREEIEKQALYRQNLLTDLSKNDPLYDLFLIIFDCKFRQLPLFMSSPFRWLVKWRMTHTTEDSDDPKDSC